MKTSRRLAAIVAAIPAVILLGSLITKLTVRDLVPVSPKARSCVDTLTHDSPNSQLELWALRLGKARVIRADAASAEVEPFTIFRLPLGYLRGTPDLKLGVYCMIVGGPDGR